MTIFTEQESSPARLPQLFLFPYLFKLCIHFKEFCTNFYQVTSSLILLKCYKKKQKSLLMKSHSHSHLNSLSSCPKVTNHLDIFDEYQTLLYPITYLYLNIQSWCECVCAYTKHTYVYLYKIYGAVMNLSTIFYLLSVKS